MNVTHSILPFSFDFFEFMSNVFIVNSGQECQIHVDLCMLITDFSYSQVGLARPES